MDKFSSQTESVVPIGIKNHVSQTLKLALPVALGQIGHILANMADTAMLGQFDTNHLAGAAFAFNVFLPFLIFGFGLSMGITPLVAGEKANGNHQKIGSLYFHGLRLYGLAGVVLAILLVVTSFFLDYMGQEAGVAELAQPYFLWLAVSMIPIAIFQHMKQYTEGMSDTKLPMLVSVYANVLNVVLNYFLIFGFGSIPPMGIVGAGIATCISRCSLVIFMVYLMKKNSIHKTTLEWAKKAKYSMLEIKKLWQISLPIGVQFTFEVSAFAIAAIMIGVLGKDFLSAHEIAIRFAALSYLTASGIGAATTIRVGEFLAKNNFVELRRSAIVSMGLVLVLMVVAASSFYVFRNDLPLLVIDSSEVDIVKNASMFLVLAAIFQFSDGIQVVGISVLRGMQDVKFPTFITLTAYWIIALPMAYYLSFILEIGPKGVWYALIIGLTVSAILLQIRLRYSYKKLN